MAKPVITTTTSVLDYMQFERWTYAPYASNTPTSWEILPITPPGMTFNTATGALSGACTEAGVYPLAITATNGDGTSDPLMLPVGIGRAQQDPRSLDILVDIDLTTRIAKVQKPVVSGSTATAGAANYEHAIKYNDDLVYHVRFWKGDTRMELPLVGLSFAAKLSVDDPVVFTSDTWKQISGGDQSAYAVRGKVSGATLRGGLLDAAADDKAKTLAQQLLGTIEFEWLQDNGYAGAIGPDPLRGSSQSMPVLISLDYQQSPVPAPAP